MVSLPSNFNNFSFHFNNYSSANGKQKSINFLSARLDRAWQKRGQNQPPPEFESPAVRPVLYRDLGGSTLKAAIRF